jgi:hypothetical protein
MAAGSTGFLTRAKNFVGGAFKFVAERTLALGGIVLGGIQAAAAFDDAGVSRATGQNDRANYANVETGLFAGTVLGSAVMLLAGLNPYVLAATAAVAVAGLALKGTREDWLGLNEVNAPQAERDVAQGLLIAARNQEKSPNMPNPLLDQNAKTAFMIMVQHKEKFDPTMLAALHNLSGDQRKEFTRLAKEAQQQAGNTAPQSADDTPQQTTATTPVKDGQQPAKSKSLFSVAPEEGNVLLNIGGLKTDNARLATLNIPSDKTSTLPAGNPGAGTYTQQPAPN